MDKLKIAVSGLDGLIGSRLEELLKKYFHFIPLSINKMDIANRQQVFSTLKNINFDLFLHLAAYTNVDNAEKDKNLAWQINVDGTKNVFEAVCNKGKKFIYISTDFVFDGENSPFFEDSIPSPVSYYGLTKYQGEKIVKDKAMIVRLSYPYRTFYELKKDIVRSIIDILKQKKPIKGIIDQILTFTFIDDIAGALKYLFQNHSNEIFHIVGGDSLSAYEAILIICDIFDLDKRLVEKTTFDEFYQGKAKRPKKGTIKSKKNNFYKMKKFREGLFVVKKQLLF